jgi:cytosine/adenosine deaminase-related metal-dependent hydrolase
LNERLALQLDEDLIRDAKVLAAEKGMSLSAMLTQEIRERLAARARREHARQAALQSMAEAARAGRTAPRWTREELHER